MHSFYPVLLESDDVVIPPFVSILPLIVKYSIAFHFISFHFKSINRINSTLRHGVDNRQTY